MTRNNHTNDRRTVLQALAAGITGSTAGCLDELVGGATPESSSTPTPNDTSTPTPTEPTPSTIATTSDIEPPATPDYTDWVFSTGLVEDSSLIPMYTISPATISNYRGRLNKDAASLLNGMTDFPLVSTLVGIGKVSKIIGTRDVYVMKGDFEKRKIDRDRDPDFERKPPEYRGFLLYENAEDGEAIGAKDGVVVATERPGQSVGPMEVLKRVIDTGLGDADRLIDERPQLDPLVSWLEDRTVSNAAIHEPHTDKDPIGLIGRGISFEFNEDAADARYVVQFEDASQATDEAVDSWLETAIAFDDWTDTSRAHYGEIVVVNGQVTYDTILSADS